MLSERSQEMSDFVEKVRKRAALDNVEEADQLSRASLEVLGQSISGGQAKHLAQWLPEELSAVLHSRHGQASAFDKANFLEKVGTSILAVDADAVEKQVASVLSTVRLTAPANELDDTLAQLPPELAALFTDAND